MADAPRVLITGAAGFVGPWLAHRLLADGAAVLGVSRGDGDDLPSRLPLFTGESQGDGRLYCGENGCWECRAGDILAPDLVGDLLADWRPDWVFHLAARSSAGDSFRHAAATVETNVQGTLAVLEAVRALPESRRPRVILAGSADEYGAPRAPVPLAESTPPRPVSPYGASKAAATLLGLQYHAAFGLDVVVARPFSHVGPGQSPRFLFPSLARQVVAAERGEGPRELAVGDLSHRRDYLPVTDVTAAYLALARRGRTGRVYNICSGRGIVLLDAAHLLLAGSQVPVTLRRDPARARPADIPLLVGDPTRLSAETGWRPTGSLEDALHKLLDWTRETT